MDGGALSPNTSALLSYLTANGDTSFSFDDLIAPKSTTTAPPFQSLGGAPASLPPSAFFNMPIPGRDTPELTPESSNAASESPEGVRTALATDSEEDGMAGRRKSSGERKVSGEAVVNKRKAGHGHTIQEEHDEDDEDSGSDDPNGHDGKRAHGNDKAAGGASGSGRRGGRKSTGGDGGSKEMSKAAKRKEQNRAAQKAFRERREAKVKDLEDKISALENKSYSATAENENLRGILKRLQEENVALKQAAFTFSMPVSGTSTPANTGSVPRPNVQRPKPPTPPHSSDDALRSIHDVPSLPHRSSSNSSGMIESPESLNSVNTASTGSSMNPSFDNADTFNAFAMGIRPEWERDLPRNQAMTAAAFGGAAQQVSPASNASGSSLDPFAAFASGSTSSSVSPLSTTSNGKAELDALWASFYPSGSSSSAFPQAQGNGLQQQQNATPTQQAGFQPFSLGQTPGTNWSAPSDKMAFRDQTSGPSAPGTNADWSNLNDDSINEFLASLSGGGGGVSEPAEPLYDFERADDFNAQLQQLLNQSGGGVLPGAAFNLSPNTFSPNAYLNLTPSPNASASVSNAHSPADRQASMSSFSNSASPDSTGTGSSYPPASTAPSSVAGGAVPSAQAAPAASGNIVLGNAAADAKVVHVVGPDGVRLKPSELWVMMGMQHTDNVDNLVIDDLCDQMKSKAVCSDGGYQIGFTDAQHIFKQNKSLDKCPMKNTNP